MNFGLVLVDMADPTPDIACACASSDALVGLVSVELDGLKGIVVGLKNGRRTLCVCVCVCVCGRARATPACMQRLYLTAFHQFCRICKEPGRRIKTC